MAKLTPRQKQNILAKWHTGIYTKTELAKQYKVSESCVRKVCDNQEPQNTDIVKAQTDLELVKKSVNSAIEIAEINKAVNKNLKELSIREEIEQLSLSGTLDNIKALKSKISTFKDANEHKLAQDCFDKALITADKAPRYANTTINNTNAQQTTEVSKIEFVRIDKSSRITA